MFYFNLSRAFDQSHAILLEEDGDRSASGGFGKGSKAYLPSHLLVIQRQLGRKSLVKRS